MLILDALHRVQRLLASLDLSSPRKTEAMSVIEETSDNRRKRERRRSLVPRRVAAVRQRVSTGGGNIRSEVTLEIAGWRHLDTRSRPGLWDSILSSFLPSFLSLCYCRCRLSLTHSHPPTLPSCPSFFSSSPPPPTMPVRHLDCKQISTSRAIVFMGNAPFPPAINESRTVPLPLSLASLHHSEEADL